VNLRIRHLLAPLTAALSLALLTTATGGAAAAAGMKGQPELPAAAAADLRKLAADVIIPVGDAGRSRTAILTLVEANATTDWTAVVAPALREENTYTALLATLEDALEAQKKDADRMFIRYNILKTYLYRARLLPNPDRRPVLAAATRYASAIDKAERDPALWEVVGDVFAESGALDSAFAAYKRMQTGGAPPNRVQYKTAYAYHRANRLTPARQAYEAGITADARSADSGRETLHLLYQGLAAVHFQEGRTREAADALLRSAKVAQDPDSPYRLRLDLAYLLLERGYATTVKQYAEAAVKLNPEDTEAKSLLEEATQKAGDA